MIAHFIDDNGAEAKFDLPKFADPPVWLWRKGRMWAGQAQRQTALASGEIVCVYRPTHAYDISDFPAIEGSIVTPPKNPVSASASEEQSKEKVHG